MSDCYTCAHDEGTAAPAERIAADEFWRVAAAFGSALPAWLVLVPRRHVESLTELVPEEGAALGPWLIRLSRVLTDVTGCVKTYVALFAEAEGFAHVHFHVVPRPPDLDPDLRGPQVFGLLGRPDEVDLALVERLRHALADGGSA